MSKVSFIEQFQFESEVEDTAGKLWKVLVKKVGESKAKSIMLGVMGDKKPGPQKPQERFLKALIQGYIFKNARESDEKIAQRILARKLHYVKYESGGVGIMNGDDKGDAPSSGEILHVDEDGWVDVVVDQTPIGKNLCSLKKRVQRIRRQMIEEGSLGKEYAPRRYYRG